MEENKEHEGHCRNLAKHVKTLTLINQRLVSELDEMSRKDERMIHLLDRTNKIEAICSRNQRTQEFNSTLVSKIIKQENE